MPQAASLQGLQGNVSKSELHSPLSPLSPGSPLFPDKIFTDRWFAKQRFNVPCLILAFFDLPAKDASDDDAIKADVNAIRTSLSRSGFRTRLASVVLCDHSILQVPALESRLASIRRQTSSDSKTGLFFMPPTSSVAEVASFVESVMLTLQPLCIEYYRELTAHSRRKKSRGGYLSQSSAHLPPATQTLSPQGWHVRYEVKLGYFAEMRQEMDQAERHYTTAIDEIFSSEGLFETIPSLSPCWNDARLLCDALAIRVLRCQLWTTQTTSAAKSWFRYRAKVRNLIDQRGKGSQNYGWAAWESRWAAIMAHSIQLADLEIERPLKDDHVSDDREERVVEFYALPERNVSGVDRLPPIYFLHHSGYWLKQAVESMRTRRTLAVGIAEEDRTAPALSKASSVASRARNYDDYLVPEVHKEVEYDHLLDINNLAEASARIFKGKGQERLAQTVTLSLAKDLADNGQHEKALQILIPLWKHSKWREDGWDRKHTELLLLLHDCAHRCQNEAVVVATQYELHAIAGEVPLFLDLQTTATGQSSAETLFYRDSQLHSPFKLSFAFATSRSYVGELLDCQLTVASCAPAQSHPLTVASIELQIEPFGSVRIRHSDEFNSETNPLDFLSTEANLNATTAQANLCFSPQEARTFHFQLPMRDVDLMRLDSMRFTVHTPHYTIEHVLSSNVSHRAQLVLPRITSGIPGQTHPYILTDEVTVLPKPPKVQIILEDTLQSRQFYADETSHLTIKLKNDELASVSGELRVAAKGVVPSGLSLCFDAPALDPASSVSASSTRQVLPNIDSRKTEKLTLHLKAPTHPSKVALKMDVEYSLASEPEERLIQSLELDVEFVAAFEVKFNFGPLLYADQWPSYFDLESAGSDDRPDGIPQLWCLGGFVKSLARDKLNLQVQPLLTRSSGELKATFHKSGISAQPLEPGQVTCPSFELETQKCSLEDRRPSSVEAAFSITWSRDNHTAATVTVIPAPRLILPVSEPRALLTVDGNGTRGSDATIHYHIENPSLHFLTFAVTMDASDEFAFSGPKSRTLSLPPLSRRRLDYHVILHDHEIVKGREEGGRWITPNLEVFDQFYQKTLRIHAATGDGAKMDGRGGIMIWVGDRKD